ncbi:hypothetical protein [Lactococcus raffinolactis]|uniref:hypothetical protein n=1 Tax=Pseudolactococcus raffinolactis TaxID=1366 RepID=UPI0039AFE742
MAPKEYLKQIDGMNRYIEQLISEVNELRTLSTSITSVQYGDRITSSTKNQEAPFVRCVMRIASLEEKINREIDRLVDLKLAVSDAIDLLDDINERILLRARYLNNKSWEEIASQLKYSLRSTHRIHINALQHFVIPE